MAFFDFWPKIGCHLGFWLVGSPGSIFFAFFLPEIGSRINLDPKKLLVGGFETSPPYPLPLVPLLSAPYGVTFDSNEYGN